MYNKIKMTTRKFMSRKTKKNSRKQSGGGKGPKIRTKGLSMQGGFSRHGAFRKPKPKPNKPIPISVLPIQNSNMRNLIKSRRNKTTQQEAQNFLNTARKQLLNIEPEKLDKYKTVLNEIKQNPNVYGTGKRTNVQYGEMLKLAKMRGINQEQFAKFYKTSGTTALSSRVEEILGKRQKQGSRNDYLSIGPELTRNPINSGRKPKNTGYMSVGNALPAKNAGYMSVGNELPAKNAGYMSVGNKLPAKNAEYMNVGNLL